MGISSFNNIWFSLLSENSGESSNASASMEVVRSKMRYTSYASSSTHTFFKEGGLNSTLECFDDSVMPVLIIEGDLSGCLD